MHRIGRAYEEAGRCGKDQGAGSPQQSFRNWYELPQALLHMLVETGGQCAGVKGRQRSFAQAAMNYPVELGQCPHRRVDRVGCPHKFSNPRRFGFVEIELDDIRGVKIHGALSIAIFFDDSRTVGKLRHASPDLSHGVENPRLHGVGHSRRSGNRTQLRDGFAAAFDHDSATLRNLANKLRSMNVEFTDRGLPHVLQCSTTKNSGA